ncbi:hypothetical protein FOCG_18482 [Fusarium oxysporum f. sp. radicis-lycopersici 26381]|nr:hypothetical protein FOCG_18482 [Fusarium oxysporum f. sp. radicis-lycopersici 26381]
MESKGRRRRRCNHSLIRSGPLSSRRRCLCISA